MQIKKFTAPTLNQASQQMKNELGPDSVILSTRVIPGDGDLRTTRMFEITAGVDETSIRSEEYSADTGNGEYPIPGKMEREKKELSEKIYVQPGKKSAPFISSGIKKSSQVKLKESDNTIEEDIKEIVDVLRHREIQEPIITAVLNQLKKYNNFLHSTNIDSYVVSSLASMIPTFQFEVHKQNRPKVVSLVGPTGVGKTTCIAKLAVISKILHNLNVGLISVDTYRLGALDQLRIFADVSNVDMLVAYEPDDIPGLIKKFAQKDVIFIDTAGRSQRNTEHLQKAKEFLNAAHVDETYLVMSATSGTKTLFDVAERFKVLEYDSVIFTKIDEAATYGNILNVVANYNVPISFLTNGQVIPDDIISADPEFTASMIYTGKFDK